MIQKIAKNNEAVTPVSREIEGLKEYFPQCFNQQGEFDIDKFREAIQPQVDVTREGRSYDFLGKSYARMLSSMDTTTVIRPDVEHNSKPENQNSENIYISGDNIDALHHLVKSYAGQVKCIYIDPPYNTGTDGFVYNDKFKFTAEELTQKLSISPDEAEKIIAMTSGHRASHAAWLTFMMPRLQLARDLLSKDGVIFISIDDNEQAYLKLLCDYLFGEENGIGPIIQNKLNSKNDTLNIQKNHEFIYCYRRSLVIKSGKLSATIGRQSFTEKTVFKEGDKYFYLNDPITTRGEGGTLNSRENLGYTFYYHPETKDVIVLDDYDKELAKTSNEESVVYTDNLDLINAGYVAIRPPRVRGNLGAWTWELDKAKDSPELMVKKLSGSDSYTIVKRTFISEEDVFEKEGTLKYIKENVSNSKSIIEFSTNDGTTTLNEIMGKSGLFNNPKNVSMLEYLISLVDGNDFTVVDFFGGSSSTAHAVMKLNAADGGSRKYILVQLPEKIPSTKAAYKAGYRTIDEIGIERIILSANKIKENNPEFAGDLGFKHYTLEEVPENTLDKLETFDPNVILSTDDVLNMFGRDTVLATWLVNDGYGLGAKTEDVVLDKYHATLCGNHLYLVDADFTEDDMTALVDRYQSDPAFNPDCIVLFGYSFGHNAKDMLEKNKPTINLVKDKNIIIDVRY